MVMKPHKVTKFTIFVMGGWRVDVVLNIRRMGVTKSERVQRRGEERESKFWSFCDNVIIGCPPRYGDAGRFFEIAFVFG